MQNFFFKIKWDILFILFLNHIILLQFLLIKNMKW